MALLFFIFLYKLCKNAKRQQENRPPSYREYYLKTARINWDKGGIDQKGLPDNSEDLQSAKSSKSSFKEKFENYRKKTFHF